MKPDWKLINSPYSTRDIFVTPFSVIDFGAKGDGKTDDTKAFRKGLEHTRKIGGGSLYVPAGQYLIHSPLKIPTSVTLRGIWQNPSLNNWKSIGSILMLYSGRGKADGTPAISLSQCSGIREITLWYPEQRAEKIVPYPFTIKQLDGDCVTIENITLVNAYQGIQIGPGGNELHLIRNVYGTPLKYGVWYDTTTDIGRLENINFNPDFWSKSGLTNAPNENDLHKEWIRKNGIGLYMGRSDWEYGAFVKIEHYHIGMQITKGEKGAPNAQFYAFEFLDCDIGIKIADTNPYGLAFTNCKIFVKKQAIHLEPEFNYIVMLNNCNISAPALLLHEGKGIASFQSCIFEGNQFHIKRGIISIVDSQSTKCLEIKAGKDLIAGILVGSNLNVKLKGAGATRIKKSDAKIKFHSIPPFPKIPEPHLKPITNNLHILYPKTDEDATNAIQRALNKVALDGGGTVFLTGGDYHIHGHLVIPPETEMKGVYDIPHHTRGGGSVLHIYTDKGKESGTPTISMQSRSGMSGLSFYYPEQNLKTIIPYPFTIAGNGKNIYILNVNAANPYQFLDLKSNCCDNHFVDYLSGAPLRMGIQVGGGSRNGLIKNTQFNPHYWARTPLKPIYNNKPKGKEWKILWKYQKNNLDALLFGHCIDQIQYQNFVFGSLYGIHFVKENNGASEGSFILGHGTDGSKISAFFEAIGIKGLDLINTELVCMSSKNKEYIRCSNEVKGMIVLHNSMLWGNPDRSGTIEGGHLVMQQGTILRQGKGFELIAGSFSLFNYNYFKKAKHRGQIIIRNVKTKVRVIANIFLGQLIINRKTIKSHKKTNNIIIYDNISRSSKLSDRFNFLFR